MSKLDKWLYDFFNRFVSKEDPNQPPHPGEYPTGDSLEATRARTEWRDRYDTMRDYLEDKFDWAAALAATTKFLGIAVMLVLALILLAWFVVNHPFFLVCMLLSSPILFATACAWQDTYSRFKRNFMGRG